MKAELFWSIENHRENQLKTTWPLNQELNKYSIQNDVKYIGAVTGIKRHINETIKNYDYK